MIHFQETRYGFEYGAATIERCLHDEKRGFVVITLLTPKYNYQKESQIDIRITKTGRVIIYCEDKTIKL